ncbi:MAG: hypothetical protein WBC44_01455 [Planctomycetaceae bacterium]
MKRFRSGLFLFGLIGAILLGAWLGRDRGNDAPDRPDRPDRPSRFMGWAGPDAVEQAKPIVDRLPDFRIAGRLIQDNRQQNVRLYKAIEQVSGTALPNIPQETGDCVSWGYRRAVVTLLAVSIATGTSNSSFQDVFPPYIYGHSRVEVGGGRLNGAGSLGAWAQETVKAGVLPWTADLRYSGRLADQWGDDGPPDGAVDTASEFQVRTTALARSAQDVCDAICNGYAVPICSQFGSRSFDKRDGKQVARGDDSWAHCMCVDAYDGSAWPRAYFHIMNSWGEDAHPAPLDPDEPPGGFWVTWDQMEEIARAGDSFVLSDFDGFPAREIDFDIIGKGARNDAHRSTAGVDGDVGGLSRDRVGAAGNRAAGSDRRTGVTSAGIRLDDRPGGHGNGTALPRERKASDERAAAVVRFGGTATGAIARRAFRPTIALEADDLLHLCGMRWVQDLRGQDSPGTDESRVAGRNVAVRGFPNRDVRGRAGVVRTVWRGGSADLLAAGAGEGSVSGDWLKIVDSGNGDRRLGAPILHRANNDSPVEQWRPDRLLPDDRSDGGQGPFRPFWPAPDEDRAFPTDRLIDRAADRFAGRLVEASTGWIESVWDRLVWTAIKLAAAFGCGCGCAAGAILGAIRLLGLIVARRNPR